MSDAADPQAEAADVLGGRFTATEIEDYRKPPRPFRASNFRPVRRGGFRGTVDVTFPSGVTLRQCRVVVDSTGLRTVRPPRIAVMTEEGQIARDDDGRVRQQAVLDFPDDGMRNRFEVAVVDAVMKAFPDAFGRVTDY
jgi:hypothetical protein